MNDSTQRAALIVMAKRPFPGQSKTRLTPPFTAREAATLYECFLRDAIDLACSIPGVTPFIAFTPQEAAPYFREIAPDLPLIPQSGTTLGERLATVLSHCYQDGYTQTAAMNSDSPTLPAAYLTQAFERLADDTTDVVLGPCDDGGYYLIGWRRPHPRLVREVKMSTPHVLQDTLALAKAENLRVSLLPAWYDVDNGADLQRVWADLTTALSSGRQMHSQHTRQFLWQHQPLPG